MEEESINNYEPKPYPLKPIYSETIDDNKQTATPTRQTSLLDSVFDEIIRIQISKERSIILSRVGDNNIWFNEKIESNNFTGFTRKGFGMKNSDFNLFKVYLLDMINDPYKKENRISKNKITDLVISHPTLDTIDIRLFVNSKKYTGFLKRGIRFTDEEARLFYKRIDKISIEDDN